MIEWISVEDRLPDYDYNILIATSDGIAVGNYDSEACIDKWCFDSEHRWVDYRCGRVSITHWMPLPEPPGSE